MESLNAIKIILKELLPGYSWEAESMNELQTLISMRLYTIHPGSRDQVVLENFIKIIDLTEDD